MNKTIMPFLFAGVASAAFAADITWSGVDGFWKTDTNWIGGKEPVDSDTAIFPIGGYTVDIDKSVLTGKDNTGLSAVSIAEGESDQPVVFRDTGLHTLNIAAGGNTLRNTPGFIVGSGRNVAIDGINLHLGSYRHLEICKDSTLSVDSGKVTIKSGNIIVNTNATLNINGGTVAYGSDGYYLKLAKNATVRFNGGSNALGRIVNKISEKNDAIISEFDGDGSKVVFAGGHNIFTDPSALTSYVDYSKTDFSFTGGKLELNQRIVNNLRVFLPPKDGVLISRVDGLCMEDDGITNNTWEIGGTAYFTGSGSYPNLGWGPGNVLKGGGKLHFDILRIGANLFEADISKVVLKTKFRAHSANGEFRFNDGVAFGACGNVIVEKNKASKFSVKGKLVFDTADANDGITPRSFDISQRFDLAGVTSLKVEGSGSVALVPEESDFKLDYLHKVEVDNGAKVALTNCHAAIKTMTLSMGNGSLLLTGSNAVDVASSVTLGEGAKIRYSFDALEAGKMYPLWFGPHGTVPPVESFEFVPALPEGWTVALQGGTAYLNDGTVIDADSDTKSYWLGVSGGNWNVADNWGEAKIPGNNVSYSATFSGDRQLSVTNDFPGDICYVRNLLANKSAGPYVISGLSISLYYPTYEGGNSSSIANSSAFPFVIESELKKYRKDGPLNTLFRVQGNSDAPVVLSGGGSIADAMLNFRGDVRVSGEWRMLGVSPEAKDSNGRDTRLVLLPGASVHVSNQVSNQTVKSAYHISADSSMTVEGDVWRWISKENMHFVDGVVTSVCPVQATARQTFIGDGTVAFWNVQSDSDGASSLKFAEDITAKFGGWKTVRTGADNAFNMVVRDNVTIGALSDWIYGPEDSFESATEASARALTVIGGSATRVKFDTEGRTVTLVDPLNVEKWSTVVKQGEGALVLASADNKLADSEFELLEGELKIDEVQSFGKLTFGGGKIALGDNFAADSYELLFTAKKIVGNVVTSGRCRVRTIAREDSVSVYARRERGTAVVIR